MNPTHRKLACAFGIMAALARPTCAAPPGPSGDDNVVQVEIWHGLRRIDLDKGKQTNDPGRQAPELDEGLSAGKIKTLDFRVRTARKIAEESVWRAEGVGPTGWPAGLRQLFPCMGWSERQVGRDIPALGKVAPWLVALRVYWASLPELPQKMPAARV